MSRINYFLKFAERFNYKLMKNLNLLSFLFVMFLILMFVVQFVVFTCHGYNISHDMADWQSFATVISLIPASFSFMFLLYTFHIQNKQNQKENFCNQLHSYLGIQRDLYKKTKNNLFFDMHWFIGEMLKKFSVQELNREIIACSYEKFYQVFSGDKRFSAVYSQKDMNDLRNYFKFLFHIVSFVNDIDENIVPNVEKYKYMLMIQAQMSNDELYCYMVNVLDYYYRVDGARKGDAAYIFILYKYDFFKDIFRNKGNDNLLSTDSEVNEYFYDEFGHCKNLEGQNGFRKYPYRLNEKIIKSDLDL